MRTPDRGCDISREWLEEILTQHEAKTSPDVSFVITSFQVSPGTNPGENFGSEVVRVKAKGQLVSREFEKQNSTKEYNLFMKFLRGNYFSRQMGNQMQGPLRELLIFSDIITELNEFQAQMTGDKYRINIPGFVHGICTTDEYVLVMQDLSIDGYVMLNKRESLDLPHTLMAVDSLARLHAVSLAFSRNHNVHFLKKYPAFNTASCIDPFYIASVAIIYDGVIRAAEQKGNQYKHLLAIMASNKEAVLQKFSEALKNTNESSKVTCLAHGDFWTNNLMFRNSENNGKEVQQPQDVMLIDWGITFWRNPLLDLQYFIHCSTTRNLRKDHLGEILHRYHSTFTVTTNDLGSPVDNWQFEDFMAEWRRTQVFGSLIGMMNTLVTMSESGKNFNKSDDLQTTGVRAHIDYWMARIMAPIMFFMFSLPPFAFVMRRAMEKSFEDMVEELCSWKNDTLQFRVFDLIEEAFENGLLES